MKMQARAALVRVTELLGEAAVRRDSATLAMYGADMTENAPGQPDAVLRIANLEQLTAVVGLAGAAGIALTPRVAGTNLGGLTIPSRGGWVLDLTAMNRIVKLDLDDMVAVVEPGVTFQQLKDELDRHPRKLTIGFPLSPPDTSVMANCLLDGLGNLSLRHGVMGEWINGLEVVRADGSLLRTGSWALGVPPFARAPLPDLTGLFVSMQGSTGLVSKLAVQLWPSPNLRERSFAFFGDLAGAMRAIRELPGLDVLDDCGALTWPTGKMLLGVAHPRERDPAEPEVFLYLDVGAHDRELLRAKQATLRRYFAGLRADGVKVEDPIDIPTLVRLDPRLGKFAEFPTRLDFLLDHPDGGLTWVGTYGPMSQFREGAARGTALMIEHGFAPTIVARPMKGGHFGVLRFIEVFERKSDAARAQVLALNQKLADMALELGFVMYKTPGWAVARYQSKLDPGFKRLLGEVKGLLDPGGGMNPGRWGLG